MNSSMSLACHPRRLSARDAGRALRPWWTSAQNSWNLCRFLTLLRGLVAAAPTSGGAFGGSRNRRKGTLVAMKITGRTLVSCALSALFVVAAARPSLAGGAGPAPLAWGRGALYLEGGTLLTRFSTQVAALPGGLAQGYWLNQVPSTGAFVLVRVTSAMYINDTNGRRALSAAGLVVASQGAASHLSPGRTTFFSIQDDGFYGPLPDRFVGLGLVPRALGNLTIQEIVALIGPPHANDFTQIVSGDLLVRNG